MDEVRTVLKNCDRLEFNKAMTALLARQPEEIRNKFKMPLAIEFSNSRERGTVDSRVAAFRGEAAKVGLDYPVLCKI